MTCELKTKKKKPYLKQVWIDHVGECHVSIFEASIIQ